MTEASMTMYDMSKQLAANEPPMDAILFNKKILEVAEEISYKSYWMLLCRERNDFTVFITDGAVRNEIAPELSETLMNRGKIIFIDKQSDDNYEIWIRDPETNENFAYYLFDYSFGIVDCKRNKDE